MPSRHATLLAGALALATPFAASAIVSPGGLSVTLTSPPTDVMFGGSTTYTAVVANSSAATAAAAVDVTVHVPAPPIPGAALSITSAGTFTCITSPVDGSQECDFGSQGDIAAAGSATVVFALNLAAPATIPTSCPSAMVGPVIITATTATTGLSPATASASSTLTADPYAVFDATNFTGPPGANQSETITFSATVTNDGPCDATDAIATINTTPLLTFVSASGITCDPSSLTCTIGALKAGASTTFSVDLKVGLPPDMTATVIPTYLTADSAGLLNDPGALDVSATINTSVTKAAGGCSSTGGGGLVGLILLAALVVHRRRRTA